jgi:hypothetical protein
MFRILRKRSLPDRKRVCGGQTDARLDSRPAASLTSFRAFRLHCGFCANDFHEMALPAFERLSLLRLVIEPVVYLRNLRTWRRVVQDSADDVPRDADLGHHGRSRPSEVVDRQATCFDVVAETDERTRQCSGPRRHQAVSAAKGDIGA